MTEKLIFIKKCIYRLHRDNKKDHELGRPAILLNFREKQSLVWIGSTKIDKHNKEKPLTLNINNNKTHFYANNINLVSTKQLKNYWKNEKIDKPYILSTKQEEKVLNKIISFTQLRSSYIKLLEENLKQEKNKNNELKKEIKNLRTENQKLNNEKEKHVNKIKQLNFDKKILKDEIKLINNKNQELNYEQE